MIPCRFIAPVALLAAMGWPAALPAAAAEPGDSPVEAAERPRVGLVLSGGGAKGGAHVGVLEVLEQMRVPVDCIAGTSVGAVVGAGYASGLDAAQVREFILGIDWRQVVGGLGQRELQTIEHKRAGVTYSNDLEFGLQHGRVIMPGGLVRTADIETLLRSYVARARMQSDFDRLPIPYRAVATDMLKGEMVALDSGDIATAMRASMAIPGVFAPVITEDHVLADGGMVRNLPVDVARELCADVVIVVNLVEQPIPRERLQSARQLAARSMSVMLDANVALQLQTLTDRDVLIDVRLGDIDAASFDRVPETMPLGAAAARDAAPKLAALAVSTEEYAAWRRRVSSPQDVSVTLAGVRYEGLERVDPAYLESRARIRAGDRVDVAAISEEARRMSALREFESVEYELEGDAEHPVLVWLPREKPWGPNYLSFDLGMYGAVGGSLAFVLNGKHTRTWLNGLGAEWRNEAQLGYETVLSTSLYQPLDVAQRFFVEPGLAYLRNLEDVYVDGDRVATYRFSQLAARLDAGVNLSDRAQARVGVLLAERAASVDTGSPELPDTDVRDAVLAVDLTYDSRDAPANPNRGLGAIFEYYEAIGPLGGEREWRRAELGVGTAVQFGDDVIWLTLAGGTDFNSNLPPDRAFALGGPASFPGYQLGELRGADYWTVGGSYLWKLRDIYALRGHALYGGLRLHAGWVNDSYALFEDENVLGASIYLTGRTLVGPLTIGIGATTTDAWSLWLGIGRPIGHGTVLERGIFR